MQCYFENGRFFLCAFMYGCVAKDAEKYDETGLLWTDVSLSGVIQRSKERIIVQKARGNLKIFAREAYQIICLLTFLTLPWARPKQEQSGQGRAGR